MKFLKLLSIFVLIINILFSFSFWKEDVNVYAEVWEVNSTPRITHFAPDFDPVLVEKWQLQSFEFSINDDEWDQVYYTITADDGVTNPINWTLEGSGTVNFVYLAPETSVGSTNLYVTLNDGVNFYEKKVNLYIY